MPQTIGNPIINRSFIEDCLQGAITEFKSDETLNVDPVFDRDTAGVGVYLVLD